MGVNYKLELVDSIKILMGSCLNDEQMQHLNMVLMTLLKNYDISQKSTELVVYDNRNEKMVDYFIGSLNLAGKAYGTQQRYKEAATIMLDTLGKTYSDISEFDMLCYFSKLSKRVTKCTYNNYRTYINQFFSFLVKKKYIQYNPMSDIEKVKEDRIIRKAFSNAEIEKMKQHVTSIRDMAIIEMLLSTGCRIGELCSINKDDISGDEIIIYGQKGKKYRKVFINDVAMYHLNNYLSTRTDNEEALFVTLRNDSKGCPKRVTPGSLQNMCRKLSARSGVENIHPHRFRRTLATRLDNKGVPIQEISVILGHENIETTRIYCNINQESLKLKHKLYS